VNSFSVNFQDRLGGFAALRDAKSGFRLLVVLASLGSIGYSHALPISTHITNNKGGSMKTKSLATLVVSLLSMIVAKEGAHGQGITPAERAFSEAVEAKVKEVLLTAARGMGGSWDIKIKTDRLEYIEREGHERGKPHEVRVILDMAYQPSETEREVMEARINKHWDRPEPIPDEVTRVAPEFEWQIHVSTIVNFYAFVPFSKNGSLALGYETSVPGTFFSYCRWRKLGTGAPIHSLFVGDYKWQRKSEGPFLTEDFSRLADCRDVRTIIMEVHSNEKVSETFIKKLDVTALNELVRTH
jgi:hypothetical protein